MSYREHIFQKNGNHVIEIRHVPAGVWISRTVKVAEVTQDAEGWHARLEHVEGTSLGTLSSKDGTALLTLDLED
jgi:hypothetical protein